MARTVAAALLLGAMVWLCGRGAGPVPPLGELLDPTNGVWGMPGAAELPHDAEVTVPGTRAAVTVLYDDRAVPHIFADNEPDAWRALGYVVARDRLFQLEMQTRAASGRLTEVAGARLLDADREMRELGLPRAAEKALASFPAGSPGRAAIDAFADGVNAYIDGMTPAQLPLEFRLLGIRPERWAPINTFHLLNRMGHTLAYEDDLRRLAARARVGDAAAEALFPARSPIQEPIQPNGRTEPRRDFTRIPPPGAGDTAAASLLGVLRGVRGRPDDLDVARAGDALGSNNWAVAPRRTAAGSALLAGDPHLELTLPSIWYEVQLTVPNALDVYGVTIPGAPGVIIGFNRDIAWTFTNTQADVIDYFAETVDDARHPTKYRVDGKWRPIEQRVERYRGPHGATIATDTLRFTERGPLRESGGRWLSTRWTVLETSASMTAFDALAHARSVEEFRRATEPYAAPAQNMLVADRAGHIGIRSTGRFPIRGGDGRGDVVRDGSHSSNDWQGAWPLARYPGAVDPAQGYLASANQQPVDPNVDPGYLGTAWFSPWRAIRINELLRAAPLLTPEAMARMQTDPGSARADAFVPVFLAAARARPRRQECVEGARLLGEWRREYTRDDTRAVLFEAAMRELDVQTWDELGHTDHPADQILLELTADSASAWWNDRSTPQAEHRDDLVCNALESALAGTRQRYGAPGDPRWRWGSVATANIRHLLRLPALSALRIPVQGGPSTLNPSTGAFGASWRMVVELGAETRGWGTYPGGQSGNPLSTRYLDRLASWKAGTLDTLRFPRKPQDLPGTRVLSSLTIVPERR
ncbi:MAG TPA: penicillin acylase family protein [Gemmatimonadaceae bacterium]|nr:penicillin acylase family protein [Gemmatimonadaceae bacterium]